MKLSLATSALLVASANAACSDNQITIDVPSGMTELTFVGYDVDPSRIVRSTGSVC
jgi:hypothetical protein